MASTSNTDQFVFLRSKHINRLRTRAYFKSIGDHEIEIVGSNEIFTGISDKESFLISAKTFNNRKVCADEVLTGIAYCVGLPLAFVDSTGTCGIME